MTETHKAIVIGLLLVTAMAASLLLHRASQDDEGLTAYALFEDAQGIEKGTRLVIAGIPVGRIEAVRLAGHRARVDVRFHKGVSLHQDATIAQRRGSMLGKPILVVQPGSSRTPFLQNGDRLAQVEAVDPDVSWP